MQGFVSSDFFNDFEKSYFSSNFFGVPAQVKIDHGSYGDYLTDNRITFSGLTNNEFLSPGLYDVTITAAFDAGKTALFASGIPAAKLDYGFSFVEAPVPDNILYYLPFNGDLGVLDSSRNGYGPGFNFINQTSSLELPDASGSIFNSVKPVPSDKDIFSIEKSTSFAEMNPPNNILSVDMDTKEISFSPGRPVNLYAELIPSPNFHPSEVKQNLKYKVKESGLDITNSISGLNWKGIASTNDCRDLKNNPFDSSGFTSTDYLLDVATGNGQKKSVYYSSLIAPFNSPDNIAMDLEAVEVAGSYGKSFAGKFYELPLGQKGAPNVKLLKQSINIPSEFSLESYNAKSLEGMINLMKKTDKPVCYYQKGKKAFFFWNPQFLEGKANNLKSGLEGEGYCFAGVPKAS